MIDAHLKIDAQRKAAQETQRRKAALAPVRKAA
jgi:hypothetical protein